MGTRTYRSDEFDKFSEREERKRQWRAEMIKRQRKAWCLVIGACLAALLLLIGIIAFIVSLVSGPDTAESENELANTPSQISLVDNNSKEKVSFSDDDKDSGTDSFAAPGYKGLIVIDPGHGGYDSGCLSSTRYEKDLDLEIALLVSQSLKDSGYDVYLTREDDSFVGINDRADLANACEDAIALISIHQNSSDTSTDEGVEVWTDSDEKSGQLAQLIVDEVAAQTNAVNGGVKLKNNLVICEKAQMPAVILVCGYLSNRSEANKLDQTNYQEKIAAAVTTAVNGFFIP